MIEYSEFVAGRQEILKGLLLEGITYASVKAGQVVLTIPVEFKAEDGSRKPVDLGGLRDALEKNNFSINLEQVMRKNGIPDRYLWTITL